MPPVEFMLSSGLLVTQNDMERMNFPRNTPDSQMHKVIQALDRSNEAFKEKASQHGPKQSFGGGALTDWIPPRAPGPDAWDNYNIRNVGYS